MPDIKEILSFLEQTAPLRLAADWDNVGLILGDAERPANRIMTCLTLSPDVAREAIEQQVDLIVSHHPLLFRAVKKLTADDPQGRMVLDLLASRIAVYSPHTAWDSARAGINQQLAEALGLESIAPLQPNRTKDRAQVVVMVPADHLERVQRAAWEAGAGVIGEYGECSFFLPGTGTFRGSSSSNPTIGEAGKFEQVSEVRVEFPCSQSRLPAVLAALRQAHPYEEPAYFIYSLQSEASSIGTGRAGTLPTPLSGAELVALVRQKLNLRRLQFTLPESTRTIQKLGICCGSGGELLSAARKAGCDAFLTGEASFHKLLEARSSNMALVLAGHYATERPAMERLSSVLGSQFPNATVWPSQTESDPLEWSE